MAYTLNRTGAEMEADLDKAHSHITNVLDYEGSDLGAKFNTAITAQGRHNVRLCLPPGDYTLTTPVNATRTKSIFIDTRGSTINCQLSNTGVYNRHCFDFTDTEDVHFYYGNLFGVQEGFQDSMIIHADSEGGGTSYTDGEVVEYSQSVSERNTFIGGNIAGYFNIAPAIHHGREISRWQSYYCNNSSTGGAFAITRNAEVFSNGALRTISSFYKGSLAAGGAPTKTWINDSTMFSRTSKGDWLLYLEGACGKSQLNNVEFRSTGEPCIMVKGQVEWWKLSNISARTYSNNHPFIYITSGSYIGTWDIHGYCELNYEGAGISGNFIAFEDNTGVATNIKANVALKSGQAVGIDYNSGSTVHGLLLKGVGVESQLYLGASDERNELPYINGRVQIDNSNIQLYGIDESEINSTTQGIDVKAIATGAKILNWHITSATEGLLLQGGNASVQNITLSSGRKSLYIKGSHNNCTNIHDNGLATIALNMDGCTYNIIANSHFQGNVVFENNALNNSLIGVVIEGDVLFNLGSDNNKLIGCQVTGTITDNGSGNVY